MTTEDRAAMQRLADATAAIEARRERPIRQWASLTDRQRAKSGDFFRAAANGYMPAEPDFVQDLSARGFVFVGPDEDGGYSAFRDVCPSDETRTDALALRMKQSGIGVYERRPIGRHVKRKASIGGESACLVH